MNDAGLFEPIIRRWSIWSADDPLKVVIGTAAIAAMAHLDGAGASTFMVTVPAMLPLYARLGWIPLVLTSTTALAAGTMNILPWGGPTSRAAAALEDVGFGVFAAAHRADDRGSGRRVCVCRAHRPAGERRRPGAIGTAGRRSGATVCICPPADDPPRAGLVDFQRVLTLATLGALILEMLPLPVDLPRRLRDRARRQLSRRARRSASA